VVLPAILLHYLDLSGSIKSARIGGGAGGGAKNLMGEEEGKGGVVAVDAGDKEVDTPTRH
jgi:hypothetical protein